MSLAMHAPHEAVVVSREQESPSIFTLGLRLSDQEAAVRFRSRPGQFNMLYLYGVGEVAISIMSNRPGSDIIEHTIREVGRVTHGFAQLGVGDRIGLRGPFGNGWPLNGARGHDVMVITGGLGCAPVVSVINHVIEHREDYGRLTILQGVKHSEDHIWRKRYEQWARSPDTHVLLAADAGTSRWPGVIGPVTLLLEQVEIDPDRTWAMLCGPEPMIHASAEKLLEDGLLTDRLWVSMERNMQCALGHCGHCQFGTRFVCRNGPIFRYAEIRDLLMVRGF